MELTVNIYFAKRNQYIYLSTKSCRKKNQYSSQTSQRIDIFTSVVIPMKSSWGFTAQAKVKLSPEMSCPQCHYFCPSYSTVI